VAKRFEFITTRQTHHTSAPPTTPPTQDNTECQQPWHTSWLRRSGLWVVRWPSIRAQARAPTYRSPLRIIHPSPTTVSLSSPRPQSIMSAGPSTSTYTSNSNFASMFNTALKSYKHKTKKDLSSHPLLPSLQSCDSPEAILAVLQEQIPAAFNQSQNGDDRLTKWVSPTVSVLYAFSATVGQGIGLVRIEIFCRGEFSVLTYTFRHSHRQMQSLRGSAFSSWSVSSMCRLRKPF
jgi:hypothetical protein